MPSFNISTLDTTVPTFTVTLQFPCSTYSELKVDCCSTDLCNTAGLTSEQMQRAPIVQYPENLSTQNTSPTSTHALQTSDQTSATTFQTTGQTSPITFQTTGQTSQPSAATPKISVVTLQTFILCNSIICLFLFFESFL
ncbi:unnamed protein product [Rotaria sp. Silwood2]|nr:unnamed protein product [Rotaria sp. Silwood2]CAF4248779.1 unnamed protein product [Rotaria sp. Silwood2]